MLYRHLLFIYILYLRNFVHCYRQLKPLLEATDMSYNSIKMHSPGHTSAASTTAEMFLLSTSARDPDPPGSFMGSLLVATHVVGVLQMGCLLSWHEGYGDGAGTVLMCAFG